MYWFTKEGKEVNRATREFWGDTDEDILGIPKREYVPYSFGIALNEGATKLWICDSDKIWYCTGAWSGGGSGGEGGGSGYDDSLLMETLAEIQQQLDAANGDIDKIKEIIAGYDNEFAEIHESLSNLDKRLTILEQNSPSMGGDCDCVQHSTLNGNWDGTMDEEEEEPEPPIETLTTWEQFIKYCADNYTDDLLGYQIIDDGPGAYSYRIVSLEEKANAKTGVAYECVVLQNTYADNADIAYDMPEKVQASGVYEEGLYYYVPVQNGYSLLTDYTVGDPITGEVYVNSIKDESGEIISKGYNDWKLSFIRQFLNAEKIADIKPTHVGDVLPDTMPEKTYLEGISQDLADNIMPIDTYGETDKVVLPSITQMNGIATPAIGEVLTYWKKQMKNVVATNSSNSGRTIKDAKNNNIFAMLIDADPESKCKRGYILKGTKAGQIGYSSALNATASMPIIYIAIREVLPV